MGVKFTSGEGADVAGRRWCLHARDYRNDLGDAVWCSRCGAIWRGKINKNGRKEWEAPMISQAVSLPSSFR